ncbi:MULTISPECIES: valine--tRNA ligase [unclassified Candidatus Nanosynbacter]|uniref:valine--tRNA ligase n=1 Tax=unclassified Candidatus Nanosynbacter TaxID=2725944 RepID=UPI001FB7BEDA|nr:MULTISPECIES: valine--tRNA ligase [unclassified Candidatus Nanosynbacter]MCJ1963680.1 valine--tRNA ligase [Candidatus Nanosynbacter sp. TM7-033]UOG68162.1 valine--tRNA ligase [Candidatus Nanosynbacter sp. HMT-352]
MQLAKQYIPNDYEPNIYALWETSGALEPTGVGKPYSIIMPPPNANGNLHIGHALDMNLKDILIRYHRMKGDDAVFIPGADHAGFETWVVYERDLTKQGKSRFDFSRDQLYSQVWNFVQEKRGNMELQLRALGVSASWKHLTFTLDEKVINTVYDTFKKMWDDNLVYRGERIVNYCTKHQTSFADIEVEHKNEKGKLWKIAYPTLDKIGEIIIATTRPETMLGDVAVAVHPDDERYKKLIGTRILLPIVDKEIPIIADEYVDMSYGTGAVKITPAHDPNDFEIAKRHDLPIESIISPEGKMINVPAQFLGLTPVEARARVLEALEALELRRGETEIEHAVGHCYKCGSVIEPMIKEQWFIKTQSLAQPAIDALKKEEITFYPASKRKELIAYLEQLKDWNISRQIPWGIPIPAFVNENDPKDWIFDTRTNEQSIVVNGTTYIREEDTFDTWFSSGQWPYIVTDYLTGGDLANYFPTDMMETGMDIMRAWVSRMIMLSLYRTGKVPFKEVYLHGMVNDEHNQKMSKSKGNVINPMELVAEFGSDATRMGVISGRAPAQSQAFNKGSVIAARNFCNKLWNIARFVEAQIGDNHQIVDLEPQTPADHWIIRQLNDAANNIAVRIEQYRFSEASETVYHTIWDDVADWYIESSKTAINRPLLSWVLATSLKIAHPFAPFVTETIWQTLNYTDGILMREAWPTPEKFDPIAAEQFEQLKLLVAEGRWVIAELPGNKKYRLLYGNDSLIADNQDTIKHLMRLEAIEHTDQPRGLRLAAANREAWLDIDSETLYQHQENLEMRLAEARQKLAGLKKRLENPTYVEKAPAHLVEETREQLAEQEKIITRLVSELEVISLK